MGKPAVVQLDDNGNPIAAVQVDDSGQPIATPADIPLPEASSKPSTGTMTPKPEDGTAGEYAMAVVKGVAHGVGVPTSISEWKQAFKDAALKTVAFPFKQGYDAAVAAEQGVEHLQNARKQPTTARAVQEGVKALPIIGEPSAAVAGPAISYSEGRAPTHQENIAAVEGGAALTAMAVVPKVAEKVLPKILPRRRAIAAASEARVTPEVSPVTPEEQALVDQAGAAQAEAATKPPTPRTALEQAHRDAQTLLDERNGVSPQDGTPLPDNVRPIRPVEKPAPDGGAPADVAGGSGKRQVRTGDVEYVGRVTPGRVAVLKDAMSWLEQRFPRAAKLIDVIEITPAEQMGAAGDATAHYEPGMRAFGVSDLLLDEVALNGGDTTRLRQILSHELTHRAQDELGLHRKALAEGRTLEELEPAAYARQRRTQYEMEGRIGLPDRVRHLAPPEPERIPDEFSELDTSNSTARVVQADRSALNAEREAATRGVYRKHVSELDEIDVDPGERYPVERFFDKNSGPKAQARGRAIYDGFARWREMAREIYGDTIPLVRYGEERPERTVLHWSDPSDIDAATHSTDGGRQRRMITRDVPIDDIVAAPHFGEKTSQGEPARQEFLVINRESPSAIVPGEAVTPDEPPTGGGSPPSSGTPPNNGEGGGGGGESSGGGPPDRFDTRAYVQEQITARENARTNGSSRGLHAGIRSFLSEAKAKLVDFNAPIEDVLSTVKRSGVELLPSRDITNSIDRVLRAPSIAGQFARDNGIVDVIREVPDLDTLDQYLIARHARVIDESGRLTGRDIPRDEQFINATHDVYEPYAKRISAYSQRLLDYSVESSLVSKDLAEQLKVQYPDYVPLERVFSEIENANNSGTGSGPVSLSQQTIVRRLRGSARQIESPIESLLTKTSDAFVQGERNKTARLLADYRGLPGNPFEIEEVMPQMNAAGDGFTRQLRTPSGAYTFSYLDDGVKRTFSAPKQIVEAAKALDVQRLGILGRILSTPVRVARVGITGINPSFLASNIARDQITGFINSPQGVATVANPATFAKALFEAVGHGDLYSEMMREGAMGTSYDLSRNAVSDSVKAIRASKTRASEAAYIASHPAEWLRLAEDTLARGEELTRIQNYIAGKEAALAKGLPEVEARIAGARNARENTTNFARRGEWGSVLNSTFLYLNANIQGTRTLLRNLQARPYATGAKIATAVFMPVAIATAWNMKDPVRRAAYEDIADFEKESNIVLVPPNPTKNEAGMWRVLKMPLSQEINNLARLPRRTLESAFGSDPVGFGDIAESLVGTVSPVGTAKGQIASTLVPQGAKVPAELIVNRNFFTGRDIVPRNPMYRSSKEGRTGGTAREIAIQLSNLAGKRVSPLQVEEAVRETFGGTGTQVMTAADKTIRFANKRWAVGGEGSLDAIYRRFGLAYGKTRQDRADVVALPTPTQ